MAIDLMGRLGLDIPLFQAPMAGVSTPAMAAAVTNAGALGALGLGAAGAEGADAMIAQTRALTEGPLNLNLFCHQPPERDPAREAGWIARMAPAFAQHGAKPPSSLSQIYLPLAQDADMLRVLVAARPAVISFHFGLPTGDQLAALRDTGALLIATATSLAEARAIRAAGLDAVIAQGWEAGGHRGIFDPAAPDERLTTEALTRLLSRQAGLPVIAAGGLMDGTDIARALSWGAVAAQMGTAFVACTESAADAGYRARLAGGDSWMTAAISGRPARCLVNDWADWAAGIPDEAIAAYPCAYDLGKSLNAAARAAGRDGFGAHWAGTGAARARAMPAGRLVETLAQEWRAAA